MPIALPFPPDASTKQALRRVIGVAEECCLGLSIRVALDGAGRPVLFVEALPTPDRHAEGGPRSASADDPVPPP